MMISMRKTINQLQLNAKKLKMNLLINKYYKFRKKTQIISKNLTVLLFSLTNNMIILIFFGEKKYHQWPTTPPLKKYLYCYTYLSKKNIFFSVCSLPPPTYTYLAPISVQIFYGYILPPQLHEICSLQNVTKYFLFLVYYYIII